MKSVECIKYCEKIKKMLLILFGGGNKSFKDKVNFGIGILFF